MSHIPIHNQKQTFHLSEFYRLIEKALQKEIKGNYSSRWKEDLITEDILKNFKNNFANIRINGIRNILNINWEAYKFNGKSENTHGDIGLLVKSAYRDGDKTEGVAFIEAKKRKRDSIRFDSIKIPQIRRINKNAPRSILLLYDYEKITKSNVYLSHYNHPRFNNFRVSRQPLYSPYTHAVAVQSDVFLHTRNKNTRLYKHSVPFAYQLCYRYLLGMDLEYGEEKVKLVKGWPSKEKIPRFILAIGVGHDEVQAPQEFNINSDYFNQINE